MHLKFKILVPVLIASMAAAAIADDGSGLLVTDIIEDSPAEEAGLIRGDILLEIDGEAVETVADVRTVLSEYEAGQRVRLSILRGGTPETISLTLETRLYRPALGLVFDVPGFRRYAPNAGTTMRGLGVRGHGIIITEIIEGGPAEAAGLKARDAILSVDGEQVPPEEFGEIVRAKEPGDSLTLEISRPGNAGDEPFEVTVRLDENDDGDAWLGVTYGTMFRAPMLPGETRERVEEMGRRLEDRMDGARRELEKRLREAPFAPPARQEL